MSGAPMIGIGTVLVRRRRLIPTGHVGKKDFVERARATGVSQDTYQKDVARAAHFVHRARRGIIAKGF